MDIRGIEVTNQLRSAIRAKLLELGVRYDEELPDYILVMVVNKKTRQQMYEDLRLFLEESTSPFVDWLHDQVLKKLQKVTVVKKKSSRDLVPTVVVKQEEERKKKKSSATSFLDDQLNDPTDKATDKSSKLAKLPKKLEKQTKYNVSNTEASTIVACENPTKKSAHAEKLNTSLPESTMSIPPTGEKINTLPPKETEDLLTSKKTVEKVNNLKHGQPPATSSSTETSSQTSTDLPIHEKITAISTKNLKLRSSSSTTCLDKLQTSPKDRNEHDKDFNEENQKKIKSSINRPKITSVVTVKNRLDIPISRHKFDTYKQRLGFDSRFSRTSRHDLDDKHRNSSLTDRHTKGENQFRRNLGKDHDFDARNNEPDKTVDIKSRLGHLRDEKSIKNSDSKDKLGCNTRIRSTAKLSNTIKDRLGSVSNSRPNDNLLIKTIDSPGEQRNSKYLEQDIPISNSNMNIKSRLGPLKNIAKSTNVRGRSDASNSLSMSSEEDAAILADDDDLDGYDNRSVGVGPIKSRIIAVKRTIPERNDKRRCKVSKSNDTSNTKSEDDLNNEDTKVASKVIVTPRPLKPLQPNQKRATQSLLLRAVAEANQSVVMQKNPEPVLMEKKTARKRPATPSIIREGQNLSVRLNSSKRLVMEKIQVELTTEGGDLNDPEPYIPQPVTDEHIGVVMSLFQRSNDQQKFLVTLNGYNNNVTKDKGVSEEDERLEMEVDEDDEFLLNNAISDELVQEKTNVNSFQEVNIRSVISDNDETGGNENSENQSIDHIVDDASLSRKKRKLSPIIYNRSRSSSPVRVAPIPPAAPIKHLEKRTSIDVVQPGVIEKSREKCRYWPNCTLGNVCTYYHPIILCSTFPACKFGDKCLYKHPKCKYGLSCTKIGCVYSHLTRQCKYHPYCSNPTCTYTHPVPQIQSVETVPNRAKLTWRKRE